MATQADVEQSVNRNRLLAAASMDLQNGCWLWRGQISNSGFGRVSFRTAAGNRMESAHRASYMTFVGSLADGEQVRQRCGNRLCINPDHLETFTPP